RQQELAKVLGLLCFLCNEVKLLELGEALDQRTNVLAEHLVDLGTSSSSVLDGVVQQRGRNGGIVKLEVGQNRGHFERVRKVGIAGGPLLLAMSPHRIDVCPIEKRFARLGVVALHPLDEVVLPHHWWLDRLPN